MTIVQLIKKNRDIGLTDNPQFDRARRCHDWRNYIPDQLREIWKDMTVESRVVAFIMAEQRANQENWRD